MRMGRRGRKRQLGVEDEYWRLILGGGRHGGGVSPGGDHSQDWVPVARRTRWFAAIAVAEGNRSSRYLSLLERQRIATLRQRGLTIREVARRLGPAGTIDNQP